MGAQSHCHTPALDMCVKTKIAVQVKAQAKAHVFTSAGSIVQSAITEHQDEAFLPKQINLERVANRYRQKFRPQDPQNLDTSHIFLSIAFQFCTKYVL